MTNENGYNKDGYSKENFLKLQWCSCPFCESETLTQWFNKKDESHILACNSCGFLQETRVVYINWVKTDED